MVEQPVRLKNRRLNAEVRGPLVNAYRPAGPRASALARGAFVGAVFGGISGAASAFEYPASAYVSQAFGGVWLWIAVPYILVCSERSFARRMICSSMCIVVAVPVYYCFELYRETNVPGFESYNLAGTISSVVFYGVAGICLSLGLTALREIGEWGPARGPWIHLVVPLLFVFFSWNDLTWSHSPLDVGCDHRRILVGAFFGWLGVLGAVVQVFRIAVKVGRA